MTIITVIYLARGEKFSPAAAEAATGVNFDAKVESGEIGKIGRYRGQATPYGRGQKNWEDDEIDLISPNAEFFAMIKLLDSAAVASGAVSRRVHLLVKYGTQCNFSISPSFVKNLALLELTVTVTCYSDPEEEAKDIGDWKELERDSEEPER